MTEPETYDPEVGIALHRIADALELLAITHLSSAARAGYLGAWEELVDNMESAQARGFFGRNAPHGS